MTGTISKKVVLSQNSETVAKARYFSEDEDWEKCCQRVAKVNASIERDKQSFYYERFLDMIYNMNFIPAGRILRNSGRQKGSLFNCFIMSIGDSIEEIGQFTKDALTLWSEGGGVGCNFSPLRPKGTPILGKGGYSSGLVSFLEGIDGMAKTIESGGARRAAGMALVDVSHPEINDFIDAKLTHGKLSHFNISIAVTEEFLEAVERNSEFNLKFKQKIYNSVNARDIWNKIIINMINCAEPGLINWDKLIKNNSWYFCPIVGVNPCSEAVGGSGEVCDLGSLVLPNFITGNVNTNWKKLEETIDLAVRFLDNIIDINNYVLEINNRRAQDSRKIGIGVMGLAEYLFAKEARYGSKKAMYETERLFRFIRDCVYQASVKLAIEKGAFPKFESIPYWKSSFIRTLPASLRKDIKERGIRNCTSLAIAPTGTVSLLAGVNSGIEPLFSKAYLRKDRVSERFYIHPIYKNIIENNKETPEWFVDTFDLKPEDHFEMQKLCQQYVDGAVSKTINLPEGTTPEQLSDLLLEYIHDLKGTTVFVQNSRDKQVLYPLTENETRKYLKNQIVETELSEEDTKCAKGNCEWTPKN